MLFATVKVNRNISIYETYRTHEDLPFVVKLFGNWTFESGLKLEKGEKVFTYYDVGIQMIPLINFSGKEGQTYQESGSDCQD